MVRFILVMGEAVNDLYETLRIPIIARVAKQFGNFEIETMIDRDMIDAEIFRKLTHGRGKGKSHCSSAYPRHEGELRHS